MPQPGENSWHLDKKVPIALIVTLVLPPATFGWLASSLNERVGQLEAYVLEAKARAEATAAIERDRDGRLVRL